MLSLYANEHYESLPLKKIKTVFAENQNIFGNNFHHKCFQKFFEKTFTENSKNSLEK